MSTHAMEPWSTIVWDDDSVTVVGPQTVPCGAAARAGEPPGRGLRARCPARAAEGALAASATTMPRSRKRNRERIGGFLSVAGRSTEASSSLGKRRARKASELPKRRRVAPAKKKRPREGALRFR